MIRLFNVYYPYPSWVVLGEGFRRSTAFIVVRRVVSIVISLIGLILALPLFPLIMFVIRLDSKGPVFYTQTRVGKNGRLFKLLDQTGHTCRSERMEFDLIWRVCKCGRTTK